MQKMLSAFWNEDSGQDMVEYTLLLGVFAVIGAGVLVGVRQQVVVVWQTVSAGILNGAS